MRDLAYVLQEDATPCVKLLFLFKGMICIYTRNKDLALEISDVILLPFTLDIPHTFIPFISFTLTLPNTIPTSTSLTQTYPAIPLLLHKYFCSYLQAPLQGTE